MTTPTDRQARTRRIAELNDECRKAMGVPGHVLITPGAAALPDRHALYEKIEGFADFDRANDPWHERDFGAFDHAGEKLFWKIDYYDRALTHGSPDPTDPSVTTRVLTIMLASEY